MSAPLRDGCIAIVGLDRLHFAKVEREHAIAADGHQRVVGYVQIDRAHFRAAAIRDERQTKEAVSIHRL